MVALVSEPGVGIAESLKVIGLVWACPGRSRAILELDAQSQGESAVASPVISEGSLWPPGEEAGAWKASEGPSLLGASWPVLYKVLSSKALWGFLNRRHQMSLSPITLFAWQEDSERIIKERKVRDLKRKWPVSRMLPPPPALAP